MKSEREPSARGRTIDPRVARQAGHHGILAVSLVAPLAIGGARPEVQVVLSLLALLASLFWLISRKGELRLPPFGGVAAVALAFTIFQLVPLPAGLLGWISPRTVELRSDALGVRPGFLPITLDVPATLLAVARGIACLSVLIVAASAARRGKARGFALALVFTAAAVATLSFVQRAMGAETILGFYRVADMPGSGFFGTFVSGNHAASFFTIGALLGFGLARESDGRLRAALAAAVVICLAGVFATSSRFGLIGAAAGAFAMLTAWLVGNFGVLRGLLAGAGAGLIAGPLAFSLALAQRGRSLDVPLDDFKIRGWADALSLAAHFPVFGVGRGAFEAPATAYRLHAEGVRLLFPENLVLEGVTEWGFPIALGLFATFIWIALPIVRRLPRWEPLFQGAGCAVIAVLVHDLADFGLEVLGVAMPTALALGLCAGRRQMSLDASEARRTPVPAGGARGLRWPLIAVAYLGAVGLVAGAGWAARHNVDADAARVRRSITLRSATTDAELAGAIARHPADYDFALQAARWGMRIDPPAPQVLRQLNRAQRLFPASAAPHVLAAQVLVRIGRPGQAAIELRLANELGAQLSYPQIEKLVGRGQLERAVPRDPDQLFALAHYLVGLGRNAEAASVSERAVLFAQASEASMVRRAEIALLSKDKAFITEAARALGSAPATAAAFETTVHVWAAAGDLAAARDLVHKVSALLPHESSLTVKGARILLDNGDPASARAVLTENATGNLPFADRIAGEELLAEIADKTGDPQAAAAARARARLLVHLRGESISGADLPR